MIKKTILFIFLSIISLQAQTAEEIINKHFEQTGGYKNWNNLNSIYIEGEVYFDLGSSVKLKIEHRRPYYKNVSFIENGKEKLSEGYDGESAYTFNEVNGKNKKLPNYKPDAFETDILNYDKKGFKVEYIGKENLDGTQTYHIKLIKNTEQEDYWFNVKNYYLIQNKNNLETVKYSDFKIFKGLVFATKMENQPTGGKDYTIIFNKIEPNKAINPRRFEFE
ncbi:hypothetical protein KRX57_00200 [Weeksellaceae bacterium TAE3-ERU29]|nr:hypothetical protein [Weeksellaceae bacterium TAE3-ERU29]